MIPWATSPADAATSDLNVPLGDTHVEITNARTIETTNDIRSDNTVKSPQEWARIRACMRYSLGSSDYSTGVVYGSSGKYAAVGYGRGNYNGGCPNNFDGEPKSGEQTSLGFQPSDTTSVKAGQVFLVGKVRHVNRPIFSDRSPDTSPTVFGGVSSAYYGTFKISTAGTIHSDFPWKETDTGNRCTGKIGPDGKMIVGQYGGNLQSGREIKTEYAYNSNGEVGPYGGQYTYLYKDGALTEVPDGYFTFDYTDKNGRSCSDDILDIKTDRSDTSWTDPASGISYKLKLWGFVNVGNTDKCQDELVNAKNSGLEKQFITRENITSYGCLYGSIEQERTVGLAKDVKADPSVHASVPIPGFTYENASPQGTYGHDNWGTPSTLTPTWDKAAVDTRTYTLLAPNDTAIIKEAPASPQAQTSDSAVLGSGWRLSGVTCVYGQDHNPLLLKDGATRLDQSSLVDLEHGTLQLDQTQLAERLDEVAIDCTWHNEYVLANGTLTLVNVVDAGSAQPTDWTLTATPAVEGLYGQKTLSGGSGSAEVTGVSTAGGTYNLAIGSGPADYVQNGEWTCTEADGTSVTVGAGSQIVLSEGKNVTCVVHHKPLKTPVGITKTVDGASDRATAPSYALSYSCTPGPDGKGTATGTVKALADGTLAELPAMRVGASCTVTEAARGTSGLNQPASPAGGRLTWRDPVGFRVVSQKNGADTEIATTAVAATKSTSGGVTFTVPDSTDGNVRGQVVNSVVPHAGVSKAFAGVVKSTDRISGKDTFDQTYTVTVTNPSATTGITYDLSEAWKVPQGVTVNKVTVSGGPITGTETPSASAAYKRSAVALPAGGTHTYTVVLNVSAPDAGLPGAAGTCSADTATKGRAVYNQASVTTTGDSQAVFADACGNVPANPKLKVSKKPIDVVRNADDTFTAGYTVTVTNTSQVDSRIIADVIDTPDLPTGTLVKSVKVLENGAPAQGAGIPTIGANGRLSSPIVLAKAGSGAALSRAARAGADGGSRTFTVQLVFTVDSSTPGYNESDFQCGHQRADGRPSGLVNAVSMDGDTDGADGNTACVSTSSALKFSKAVATQPGNGSSFDVVYTISVVNEGSLPAGTGVVTDRPSFAPGLVTTGVRVSKDGGPAMGAPDQGDGSYRVSNGDTIASGKTIAYTVTFSVTVDPSVNGYNEDLLSCSTQSQRLVPGHGLYNKVVPAEGKDTDTRIDHDVACANVSPDAGKRTLSIVKTGSQGPLDDATFDLYPVDPSTSGAKPIVNGVSFTGGRGTGMFTTVGIAINREYWLVETKAPAGHQLMAKPVRFKVTASGIELITTETGTDTVTVSRSGASSADDTITVRDVQVGTLPLSGGHGIAPNVVIALITLAGAALLAVRACRRASSSRLPV